ncbi:MAG TPA: ABC transporter ATP-binding protein [Acidimicrobiia bacterium]|nr:ABC transporter ATP-binding protein [Acidimicrobiia bacterium]
MREARAVTPLVELDDIGVQFGGLRALDDVNLFLLPGEITGLIGPNGAGKSTLLNVVGGSQAPTTGRVGYRGADVTRAPAHARARMGVARTFQTVCVASRLSALVNVRLGGFQTVRSGLLSDALGLSRRRSDERHLERRVDVLLDLVGLSRHRDVPAGDLPLGLQRSVELARALCAGPRLLLLDEPASGLDSSETASLADVLLTVREELGTTLLLVDHDVSFVTGIADYVYVLDFGQLIAEGEPRAVLADPRVEAAYLGQGQGVDHVAARG